MATINTIVVSGRLTADPELRYTQSGTAVANGNIAVTDGYGDKEKTFFFKYEAWQHTAEYLGNYAKKGMLVTLHGKLTQQEWEDDKGNKKQKVSIRVSEAILPPKGASSGKEAEEPAFGLGLGEEIVFSDEDLPF